MNVTVEPYRTNAGLVGTGSGKVAITEGMNLCTYSDGVKFGYIDGAGQERLQEARIGEKDFWRVYKVTVAWVHDENEDYQTASDGQQYTDAQMYSSVNGKNYTLGVARDTANSNVSYAKFFAATDQTAAMADGSTSLPLQTSEAINSTNFAKTWYFGVYIDGHDHATDNKTSNGNFVVTFTQVDPEP